MQVLVANPTLQYRRFSYRHPSHKTTRTVEINAGGQTKLPDDLSGYDLENVLEQLTRYGAVPASEVNAITMPKALIFDVSKTPIAVDRIEEGLGKDEDARQDVSAQKLEEAGLGAFKQTEDLLARTRSRGHLVETSIEIVETTDHGKTKDGVNTEFVVSTKAERRAGKKRTERKA